MDASSNQTEQVPKNTRGDRLNVVNNRTSTSKAGRETRIENLAPEEWRPHSVCSMSMDKALREMEFPSRLVGASWVLP